MSTKKDQVSMLSPIDAYNQAVDDCAKSADIKVTGDREIMSFNNCSPTDICFFGVDQETILKNKIPD